MDLIVALGTDDGKTIHKGHFGESMFFDLFYISENGYKFVQRRKNPRFEQEQSEHHGDPKKAGAISEVLRDVHALCGIAMGTNIKRMVKKYVPVIVDTHEIDKTLPLLKQHFKLIKNEFEKGENRNHIVLRSQKGNKR